MILRNSVCNFFYRKIQGWNHTANSLLYYSGSEWGKFGIDQRIPNCAFSDL